MNFYIVDVFAEQKYQGNQLAVLVPDCELSVIEMQKIAKEINFSETSFVLSVKQENGGYDVKIFTPDVEVPFAGHPTLGTAYVIHKVLEGGQSKRVVLNLDIGQIPVSINKDELIMTQNEPSFGMIIKKTETIVNILKINNEDIDSEYPIQVVSTGLPCIIVPLKSLDAVKRCCVNHDKFNDFINHTYKSNLLVFSREVEDIRNDLHVRVFMDDTGFLEDPATGSANGNLAGYLLKYDFFQKNIINLRIEQGYSIQRPSLINAIAKKENEKYSISVGGKVQLVVKGEWLFQ